jgi:hypothetical protein
LTGFVSQQSWHSADFEVGRHGNERRSNATEFDVGVSFGKRLDGLDGTQTTWAVGLVKKYDDTDRLVLTVNCSKEMITVFYDMN